MAHQLFLLGVEIKRRKKKDLKTGTGATTKSFGSNSLQNAAQKCFVCSKTVYPMEFVGVANKVWR